MKILCENNCGQEATYITWNGKHKCSKIPARCPAVQAKMQATSIKRYGVPNASSSPTIKEKRQQVMEERYGVSNAAHIPEARAKIKANKKEYWNEYHNHKDYSVEGLTLKQYIDRCHQYADTMYNRHKGMLDPQGLRGREWHIDHIYSVADGFRNSIPANIVSDITNLRLVHCTENYAKSKTSHKSKEQLYEDFSLGITYNTQPAQTVE